MLPTTLVLTKSIPFVIQRCFAGSVRTLEHHEKAEVLYSNGKTNSQYHRCIIKFSTKAKKGTTPLKGSRDKRLIENVGKNGFGIQTSLSIIIYNPTYKYPSCERQ